MERIRKLLESGTGVRWLFHGDSITHGAVHTYGQRDYTELFAERIRAELRRRRDLVIKSAFDGDTTEEVLADFDVRVEAVRPQVVWLMIGMNDCSTKRQITPELFRVNLDTIATRTESLGAFLVLQTPNPILTGQDPTREPRFENYLDILRPVAATRNLPLIDHVRHWRGEEARRPGMTRYWMSDACHPNQYGHVAFAELLFRELGIFEPASPTCRLFKP